MSDATPDASSVVSVTAVRGRRPVRRCPRRHEPTDRDAADVSKNVDRDINYRQCHAYSGTASVTGRNVTVSIRSTAMRIPAGKFRRRPTRRADSRCDVREIRTGTNYEP
jgi:hypothetical protein